MKGMFFILLSVFSVMEIVAWKAYTVSKQEQSTDSPVQDSLKIFQSGIPGFGQGDMAVLSDEAGADTGKDDVPDEESAPDLLAVSGGDEPEPVYPRIAIGEKDGVTERTIYMGVRQWAWDPSELRVKQGELVRLVIHNADVRHAIVIPELGVEADIPKEGAIVEFTAARRGMFDFLCSTYCGTGHAMMQGRIVVE